MTTSFNSTGSASLYSDTNHNLTPGEFFAAGPAYPTVLSNGHFADPRRTISSPPLPSAHPLSINGKSTVTHDTRSPIQRLGHLPVHQHDAPILRELIKLHNTELSSLNSQLQEADRLLRDAEERVVHVHHQMDRGILKRNCLEILSANAVRESVMQARRGVQDRITHLRRSTEAHKGLLHPIRKLPMELLLMIMQSAVTLEEVNRRAAHFLPNHPSSPRRPRSPPARLDSLDEASNPNESPSTRQYHPQPLPIVILLSQVCSDWRKAVHGTPALWRTIHFRLTGQPDVGLHSWAMVRYFMEKAKHDRNTPQPSVYTTGMSLVFTGWVEHDHPAPSSSLHKVLRMLAENEGGKSPGETSVILSHNRRHSDAHSIIELSLTPESEEDAVLDAALFPGPPDIEETLPESVRPFRIDRLEIDFQTLCEHEIVGGQSRSDNATWLATCPKPREVVFIAHDSVYGAPPHGHGHAMGLLSPPYSKSLIPHARHVTLCNLSFEWPSHLRLEDPYANLVSLKLIYTRHFDRLLQKPEGMDNLGFLQFLKVAPNLVDLELRLAAPTVADMTSAVPPDSRSASTNGALTMVPISIPASLEQLTISLPDLCRVIPLFLPESSRPMAPSIHLSSLHHISFLPFDARGPQESWLVERNADLIQQFLQTTEAVITHLEFLYPEGPDSVAHVATSSATLHQPRHAVVDPKDQISFLLRQFHSCHTLEGWSDDNTRGVMASLGVECSMDAPSISIVSGSEAPSILPSPPRASSSLHPAETAISKVQSEALRNHSSSAPQSGSTTGSSSLSPPPTTPKSPKKLSKPPRRSSTIKPRKRTFGVLSTPMDIIANVLAPMTKRYSLALVESPVGTPKMAVDEPAQPVPEFVDLHDPGLLAPPLPNPASVRSSASGGSQLDSQSQSKAGTSSQVDASSAHGDEAYTASSTTSREAQSNTNASARAGEDETGPFPSVKKIIVHDAPCFAPGVVRNLVDRGIEVVVYG